MRDPARLDMLHHNDWNTALQAKARKECTTAATEIIVFFKKLLFIAGLYGDV